MKRVKSKVWPIPLTWRCNACRMVANTLTVLQYEVSAAQLRPRWGTRSLGRERGGPIYRAGCTTKVPND
jgi:hypothetical protein